MTQDEMKKAVALAALDYVESGSIVGVGTGSTANYFIDGLATIKGKIDATVPVLLRPQTGSEVMEFAYWT